MTANELQIAAQELFGPRGWVAMLADRLQIDRTSVYRYVNGQIEIPGPVASAVKCWLDQRNNPNGAIEALKQIAEMDNDADDPVGHARHYLEGIGAREKRQ